MTEAEAISLIRLVVGLYAELDVVSQNRRGEEMMDQVVGIIEELDSGE